MRSSAPADRAHRQSRPDEETGEEAVWSRIRAEIREIGWLMATVGALSAASVALAVVLASIT